MCVFEGYIVHEWERAGQEEDAAGMFRMRSTGAEGFSADEGLPLRKAEA